MQKKLSNFSKLIFLYDKIDNKTNVAKCQMSNFAMGTILGKGFPQAQVHTVHSWSDAFDLISP